MAERTGCPILLSLWSYVKAVLLIGYVCATPYCEHNKALGGPSYVSESSVFSQSFPHSSLRKYLKMACLMKEMNCILLFPEVISKWSF